MKVVQRWADFLLKEPLAEKKSNRRVSGGLRGGEGGWRSGLKPGAPQIYIFPKVFFLTKNIFDF